MPVSFGTLTPYVGLYGEYDFGSDDALPSGVLGLGLNDGWSLRATNGVSIATSRGLTLSFGSEWGGIGADIQTHSLRAGAAIRF